MTSDISAGLVNIGAWRAWRATRTPRLPFHHCSNPSHLITATTHTTTTHARFMASLPFNEQSAAAERSPTKIVHNSGGEDADSPDRLDNSRPAATSRRSERPSDNFDAYPPVKVSVPPHRRRGGLRGGGAPPSLIHGLAATRRFFLDEDKTLHEEYVPNYRCISSLSPRPNRHR